MTDDFTPTPASAWVDPNPAIDVDLPSGNKATVKKPNVYILGRTGQMPADVQKAAKRSKARAVKAQKDVTPRDAVDALDDFEVYVDWLICRAFIAPCVTVDGAGDSLPLSALTSDDKMFVVRELGIEV